MSLNDIFVDTAMSPNYIVVDTLMSLNDIFVYTAMSPNDVVDTVMSLGDIVIDTVPCVHSCSTWPVTRGVCRWPNLWKTRRSTGRQVALSAPSTSGSGPRRRTSTRLNSCSPMKTASRSSLWVVFTVISPSFCACLFTMYAEVVVGCLVCVLASWIS